MDSRLTTRILPAGEEAAALAAQVIQDGGIVAIPTETVYGLAANAFDGPACRRIFEAKGRPQDNPLIVHVADEAMVELVCKEVPPAARRLMDAFWPGPLSIVMKKTERIPDAVSAALPTAAVRMPGSETARQIISAAGVPLAAPSANRSGRPSPTRADHVFHDMAGIVPLIVDGGPCTVGVESTVVDVTGETPVILRPGDISAAQIAAAAGCAAVHTQTDGDGNAAPASPGMKYRHYSPKASVRVFASSTSARDITGAYDAACAMGLRPVILCPQRSLLRYGARRVRSLGRGAGEAERAIFAELRGADERNDDLVLIEYADEMGEAVKDRIMRAADTGSTLPHGQEQDVQKGPFCVPARLAESRSPS